ncbi:MAG: PRD domain-containing protein, partial [Cetobacterium sp.]
MKIKKILNNNVAISENEDKQEIIVAGCGIAFKKKIGDDLDESLIEKIFVSSDNQTKKKIQVLLDEIPIEYIRITDKIVRHTNEVFKKELNDITYIGIADHIYRSVERFITSGELVNGLLWDIKRLYKEEFEVGLYALEIIKEELKIQMPEDEAAFIATHIINAKLKETIPNVIDITKLINEILNIVKYNLLLDLDEESQSCYYFINNIKFLAQKVVNNKKSKDIGEYDQVYIATTKSFPREYYCVEKITEFIERKYKYMLNIDERV